MKHLPAKDIPDPDAYPISHVVVDWDSLLATSNKFFGRSLTRGLDEWHQPLNLLAILEEFRRPGSNPHHAMRDGPLEFIHQSFLVFCPHSVIIGASSLRGINILMPPEFHEKNMAVLGGDLRAWHDAIVLSLTPTVSRETRQLFNKILLHFEKLGLGGVFRTHAKRNCKDGTFCLILK